MLFRAPRFSVLDSTFFVSGSCRLQPHYLSAWRRLFCPNKSLRDAWHMALDYSMLDDRAGDVLLHE